MIFRPEKKGFALFFMNYGTLFALKSVDGFLEFGIFLSELVQFLIHNGVIAWFKDRKIVDTFFHIVDLIFHILYYLPFSHYLFLQLFVLVYHFFTYTLLLFELVSKVLQLHLKFSNFLAFTVQRIATLGLHILLHSVPLALSFLELLSYILILPRFFFELFLHFLLLLSDIL